MRLSTLMRTTTAMVALYVAGPARSEEITTLPGPASVERAYGTGEPLPLLRQAADCYSIKDPTFENLPDFNYPGDPSQNCFTTDYITNRQIRYKPTNSATGINAFFSHDPTFAGDVDPAAGVQLFPRIDFAGSTTPLRNSDINIYNNGGTLSTGLVVVAPGTIPPPGQYPNPRERYGAAIQFPILIAPVTIAYDPVYKKVRAADGSIVEYPFNNRWERPDSTGGLHLDQPAICAIFNGDITNWNVTAIRVLNKNTSLKSPADPASFSVPLQIVGRRDSASTTLLWTRFLANACAGYGGNSYGSATSRLPGVYREGSTTRTTPSLNRDLAGAVWDKLSDNSGPGRVFVNPADNQIETLGLYTLADGGDGVSKYIDFTQTPGPSVGDTVIQGRIGYIGPEYVLPSVLFTGRNLYGLKTVDVKNLSDKFRAPTPLNALQGLQGLPPPESNTAGAYVANPSCSLPSPTGLCRKNPADWVDPNNVLANPLSSSLAYPIIGTFNILSYSCHEKAFTQRTLLSFLGNYYLAHRTVNDTQLGLIAAWGYAPMPQVWRSAIKQTFLNTTDSTGLGLTMSHKESGGAAKCL